jgi:hypothetical protein
MKVILVHLFQKQHTIALMHLRTQIFSLKPFEILQTWKIQAGMEKFNRVFITAENAENAEEKLCLHFNSVFFRE